MLLVLPLCPSSVRCEEKTDSGVRSSHMFGLVEEIIAQDVV